jgi:hypothetical protein
VQDQLVPSYEQTLLPYRQVLIRIEHEPPGVGCVAGQGLTGVLLAQRHAPPEQVQSMSPKLHRPLPMMHADPSTGALVGQEQDEVMNVPSGRQMQSWSTSG